MKIPSPKASRGLYLGRFKISSAEKGVAVFRSPGGPAARRSPPGPPARSGAPKGRTKPSIRIGEGGVPFLQTQANCPAVWVGIGTSWNCVSGTNPQNLCKMFRVCPCSRLAAIFTRMILMITHLVLFHEPGLTMEGIHRKRPNPPCCSDDNFTGECQRKPPEPAKGLDD